MPPPARALPRDLREQGTRVATVTCEADDQTAGRPGRVAVVLDPGHAGRHGEHVLDGAAGVAGVGQPGHVLDDGVVEVQVPGAGGATDQVGQHRLGHRRAEEQRLGGHSVRVPLVYHGPGAELAVVDEKCGGVGLGHPRLEVARPARAGDLGPQRAQGTRQRLGPWGLDLDVLTRGIPLRIDERHRRQPGTFTHRICS
jgi:hypothetical protein